MSGEREALRAELLTWVRQNEGAGADWFLDEGAPPLAEPTEIPAADETAAAAVAEPAAAPRAEPTATPVAEAAATPDKDPVFQKICADFVGQTMDLIRRHGQMQGSTLLPAAKRIETLDQIAAEVTGCTACPLHQTRKHTVFGAGHPDASLVFIGEAPGADEDRQGQPFVGKSGQLLGKIIEAIGFTRDDVFICNILKCRPPNNRDPQADEVAACEGYLKRQLALIRPRVICCLGRVAAQTLLKTPASLTKLRGGVHFYEGIPVMATYHPAALLRNPGWKRDTWEDVRKLRALHDAIEAEHGE